MKDRWAALAPLALLALLVGLAGFVLFAKDGGDKFEAAALRAAPALTLPGLDGGGDLATADLAGEPYVINIFASWCTPCRAEHPLLLELSRQGVTVVGVAYKDDPQKTRAFLAELGDPYTMVGVDRDGRAGLSLGIAGVPETFVIDAQGRIRAAHRGPLTAQALSDVVRPALRQNAAP